MPDRFTEGARSAINHAWEEARRFHHRFVDTEHLLLGLIRDGTTPTVVALERLGVPLVTVKDDLERVLTSDLPAPLEPGFTLRAKRVFALAAEEARELGHYRIGAEDVLLGMMREGESIAARILGEFIAGPFSRVHSGTVELLARTRWPGGYVSLAAAYPWRG